MKSFTKIIVLLALSIMTISVAKAQEPLNVIKLNPLRILWAQIPFTGEYGLTYERAFPTKLAAQIGLAYTGPSALINLEDLTDSIGAGISVGGVRVTPSVKFYLTSFSAPKGFYISPMLSYNTAKFKSNENPNDYLKATFFNVNLLGGYQIIAGGAFALDIFTGVGFKNNNWEFNNPSNSIFITQAGGSGAKITLGFNAGVAF